MQFFKPSDIRTVECVVTNITRAGAAFASAESGDSVYIPVRFAEQNSLDVGDMLTCYCIDQSLDEHRKDENLSARYRAVRMRVTQRLVELGDEVREAPKPVTYAAAAATAAPPPKPLMATSIIKEKVFEALRKDDRAWSSRDLADYVAFTFKDQYTIPEEIGQKVSAMLHFEHEEGNVAACSIKKGRDQKMPSALYYALNTDTLIDLMEGYEVTDE